MNQWTIIFNFTEIIVQLILDSTKSLFDQGRYTGEYNRPQLCHRLHIERLNKNDLVKPIFLVCVYIHKAAY